MKRSAKIYIIALIWGAALIQLFFNSKVNIEEEVIHTFAASDISEYETDIMIWGEYGNASYDETTVRNILVNMAAEFGISDGYILSAQDSELEDKMLLEIQNREDSLSFQFVTEYGSWKSFLVTTMTLQGMKPAEIEPTRVLENFYEDIGIDYRKSISVRGSRSGNFSVSEMDELSKNILEEIDGKYVNGVYSGVQTNEISENMPFSYEVYGYTKDLPVNTYVDEKKVNIRIVFNYDPSEQNTNICVKFIY